MAEVHAKFSSGPEFAEAAEVLKVPTDHIMAMMPAGGRVIVLYTPELPEDLDPETDDPKIYEVVMSRDRDGILHEQARRWRPGLWAELRRKMESGG